MPTIVAGQTGQVRKVWCEDGGRYLVYNAAAIGNPTDHIAEKWYFRAYRVAVPLGDEVGEPFDSAEEAEQAVRARHARGFA